MNELKTFPMGPDDNSWKTSAFRQTVVGKIEEAIQRSGMQVARNSNEMENHVFMKAKTKEEYMNMVAKLILHVREMPGQQKANQVVPNMQGPNQNQMGANQQVQNQAGQAQGPGGPQTGLAPDPINALQNLASQGSRNQMMNMGGPQGQMQQQNVLGQNPGMAGMQAQMGQQGPIASQSGPQGTQTASNLLQTLTQRPQLNMQMQGKLGPMGMVPNQNQMGSNMVPGMGGMGNPMAAQLQNQLGGPGMQGQMMPNMSMQNSMPMSVANSMVGQMQCNQVVGGMTGQLPTTSMQSQMPGQMVGMAGNQMGINMLQHIQSRTQGKPDVSGMLTAGYGARGPQPSNFFRQSPSPSAPSPNMGGPSPASMGVMGNAMSSPMSLSNLGCAGGVGVGSPAHAASPSAPHLTHHPQQMAPQQRGVGMSMVASPSSSLNTPVGAGAGVASPGGEEAAYREKVRQLSKYIEPLRRMVHRMVSEGENVEKLTKMKNLLDILSNPNKRMPLETLIKCEVVLEKLDFKRSESVGLGPQIPGSGKEQIFNPLLEVVNNCLQSPLANHTLKRTFASTLDALNGPEIKNLPPPHKVAKSEETEPEIPDILQGEIARLDSRFKVSLETMQLSNGGGGGGAISLIAQLDDARLPCVPPVHVSVPRDYPARAPAARLRLRSTRVDPPDSFLARVEKAMEARCARLPKGCSLGQLLDAWEMSVRQACTPHAGYTPVSALGI